MFIKKIKKKHLNTGKNYFVFQLFEEIKEKGQVKLNMILTLGPKLNIPETEHQLLADCIESKTRKQTSSQEFPSHIEKLAEVYAAQLQKREFARRKRPSSKPLKKTSSFAKRDYSQAEDDFETKRKPSKFGNKPLAINKLRNSRSDRPFEKSHASDRQDEFKKESFRSDEFEPRKRFGNRPARDSRFSKKPSSNRRVSFKEESFDDEEGYEPRRRSGRFERNASDRGDGFIQRTTRSFNKTNREESSKQNDDFEPQKRSSRPFSKSRPNSSSDDRRSKPSFGPKKAFSKFGKRPEGKSFSRKKPSKSRFPKKRDD